MASLTTGWTGLLPPICPLPVTCSALLHDPSLLQLPLGHQLFDASGILGKQGMTHIAVAQGTLVPVVGEQDISAAPPLEHNGCRTFILIADGDGCDKKHGRHNGEKQCCFHTPPLTE